MKNKILIPSTTLAIITGIASGFTCASCSNPLPPSPPGPQPEPGDIIITPPENKVFTESENISYTYDDDVFYKGKLTSTFEITGFKVSGTSESKLTAEGDFVCANNGTNYQFHLIGILDTTSGKLLLSFSIQERANYIDPSPSEEASSFNSLVAGTYPLKKISIYLDKTKPLYESTENEYSVKIDSCIYAPKSESPMNYYVYTTCNVGYEEKLNELETFCWQIGNEIHSPFFRCCHFDNDWDKWQDFTIEFSTTDEFSNLVTFNNNDGFLNDTYESWFDLICFNIGVTFSQKTEKNVPLKIAIYDSESETPSEPIYQNNADGDHGEPIFFLSPEFI